MGVQAGVFFFDGRPVGGASRAVTAGLEPFAPDGVTPHAADGVVMASGGPHVWTGGACDQPVRSASGLVLTWDGRIDNGDDLRMRLGSTLSSEGGDAALALAVFERWGADGLRSVVGEWSLVVWDGHSRTLHLARDYMGARPLYYCVDHDAVMWSTSLGELVARAGRRDALSESFITEYVTNRISGRVTPYEGVRPVPTATCVSFTWARRETRRRFWSLEQGSIRYADKRTYEEQLRQLWREAVGVRLRSSGMVWAELSGGLDSSSVVCMADLLIKEGRVDADGLRLVSHATLESSEGDERRFIAEVEARIGVRSEIVGVEAHRECVDDRYWVTPYAAQGAGLACLQRVRHGGGRLVLSGRLGDAVMGCQPDNSVAVFDDLARGRVLTALANVRQWSRACRQPFVHIAWELARAALSIPPRPAPPQGVPGLLGIDLLSDRLRSIALDWQDPSTPDVTQFRRSKRDLARMVIAYCSAARLDIPHQPENITYAYPFAHRPLLEFMMAIPGEELSAPGDTRSLMRRAFLGVVPPRVLKRQSKGYYPPAAFRATRRWAESIADVEHLEVVQRGWVDAGKLRRAIHVLMDGGGQTGGEIYSILRLEGWLLSRLRPASPTGEVSQIDRIEARAG